MGEDVSLGFLGCALRMIASGPGAFTAIVKPTLCFMGLSMRKSEGNAAKKIYTVVQARWFQAGLAQGPSV